VNLEGIASRIAADEPVPGPQEEEAPENLPEEKDIKWDKLNSTHIKMKSTLLDFDEAIDDRNITNLQRSLAELVKHLIVISKATRQRKIKKKLDIVIGELE